MPSDADANANAVPEQRRAPGSQQQTANGSFHHPPPAQAESLPCPRCDSTNTKFCYYNNYNLSQPRHFCKACRRYWTHGGTLRNIPVGGGTRKSTSCSSSSSSSFSSSSSKRPRSSPNTSSSAAVSGHEGGTPAKPDAAGLVGGKGVTPAGDGVGAGACGGVEVGFTSLLNAPGSHRFLALGGYGPALDGFGFGFGRGVWPFTEVGFVEGGGYGGFQGSVMGSTGVETWHVGGGGPVGGGEGGGDSGLVDGDGFAWPELAISMPGQGLK